MWANSLAKKMIRFYQKYISVSLAPRCRYIPTCSQYALEAYETLPFLKATWKTIARISRCHPFVKGGYDPVNKEERIQYEKKSTLR